MKNLQQFIYELIDRGSDYYNTLPDLSKLADGVYKALYYAHCFELENGKIYYSKVGVRHPKFMASLQTYEIKNGQIV